MLQFATAASLYEVQVTVLTAFPGTPLYDRLLRENRIIEPEAWHLCTLFDVNYLPKRMSPEELRQGLYSLAARLYDANGVKLRRKGFFAQLRKGTTLNRELKDELDEQDRVQSRIAARERW